MGQRERAESAETARLPDLTCPAAAGVERQGQKSGGGLREQGQQALRKSRAERFLKKVGSKS